MKLTILIITALLLTNCGTFGVKTGIFEMEKQGDNGIVVFNDEDTAINPDGSIDTDITSIFIIETQENEETVIIFSEAFKMLSDFFKEHADVYKSIGE